MLEATITMYGHSFEDECAELSLHNSKRCVTIPLPLSIMGRIIDFLVETAKENKQNDK